MDSSDPAARAFLATLETAIENGKGFSVLEFRTLDTLPGAERRKLLHWAGLVIGTCLPRAGQLTRLDPAYACFVITHEGDTADAAELAEHFAAQLNKLPVGGVAPGRGWESRVLRYPAQADLIEALLGQPGSF
jgi:hypothetical protein